MTTQEIADKLVAYCRKGEFDAAQKELFAPDAVSIEPYETPAFPKETKGLQAIKEKGEKWNAMVQEVNGLEVSDPLVGTNSFACTIHMKVTMKERGPMDMKELCVYRIANGKIISEEFIM